MTTAQHWIETLNLERHPEGGWFREFYRASEMIAPAGLPERFGDARNFSTAIYYLLSETDFSAFHRIKQDEVWHFYDGTPLTIHMIDPEGNYSTANVGRDAAAGESLVAVVPAGWMFGASVDGQRGFALLGCTVAPGFDFDDFELPSRAELLADYPQHREIVEKLTK